MECENKKHPIVGIEGFAASGKQFDLDITIPEDGRNVIYGVVRDCYKNPVCDAVVKLIEVEKEGCREDRKPVSHTFTDKHGEFVFGPLCPHKFYSIEIWANKVEHIKICAKCNREGNCLKGIELGPCDCFIRKEDRPENHCYKDDFQKECKPWFMEDHKDDCKKECKSWCMEDHKDDCKKECKSWCMEDHKDDCKKECKPCCMEDHKDDCKKECKPCCMEDHKDDCKKECKSCCMENHKDDDKDDKKECRPCCKPCRR